MEKRVREFVTENELLMPEQTIGAAVSGGPDSMALLHCLCSLAPLFSCSVACVHFEPVSYTHLDVYKRQGKRRSKRTGGARADTGL